jgi:transcriptional regulator with XRE-family HTH domain
LKSLRRIREHAGYSQQDLADETGVSQHTISEIELGRRKPQGRTLRKLAKALDVKVADLVEVDARPKARVLSPRDTEAVTAPPDGEVLFEVPCPSENYEEGMAEAIREAKSHQVPEDMLLNFVLGDGKVEVRITPKSSSRTRRRRRLTTKTRDARKTA